MRKHNYGHIFLNGKYVEVVATDEKFFYIKNGGRILRYWAEVEENVKCKIYHTNFTKKNRGLKYIERIPTLPLDKPKGDYHE